MTLRPAVDVTTPPLTGPVDVRSLTSLRAVLLPRRLGPESLLEGCLLFSLFVDTLVLLAVGAVTIYEVLVERSSYVK